MSTTITTAQAKHIQLQDARPSFFGLVRGEFFKAMRQWTTWIMLVMLLGVIVLPYLILGTAPNAATRINSDPLHYFYDVLSTGLSIVPFSTSTTTTPPDRAALAGEAEQIAGSIQCKCLRNVAVRTA